MPYRISKSDIEHIADILPDAYILDDNGETVELVLQGSIDPKTAVQIIAVHEDSIEEYRKERRQQLLDEVREVRSFRTSVKKRVLCAIVNDAVNSIHS